MKTKRVLVRQLKERVLQLEQANRKLERDVAAIERADTVLRERDEMLHKLASQVPGMLYQFARRPDGTYCVPFASDSIREIFGCSAQEVRDDFSPIARVIAPEDLEPLVASIEESAAGLTPWQCEYRVHVPGGPTRWLWGQSIPERLPDGSTFWHGFNTDVTERRRTEAALLLATERLRRLIDSNVIGVIIANEAGNVLEANDYYLNLIGFSRRELNDGNVDWRRITPHEWLPVDAQAIRELRDRGICTPYEKEYLRRDGSRVSVLLSDVLLPGPEAQIMGVVQDITESRRAEAALRESERRLRVLNEIGNAMRELMEPKEIMAAVVSLLGNHLGASRCAYANVDADGEHFVIQDDYTNDCASSVGSYQLSLFGPQVASGLRAGHTLVIDDVDAELSPSEGADMFNAIAVKAIVCCPLLKQGALRAMMAVHQTIAREWTPGDVSLVEDVVDRCWAFIEQRRAEVALRRSEERLREASLCITDIAYSCVGRPSDSYVLDWVTGDTRSVTGHLNDEFQALGCWGKIVVEEDRTLFEEQVEGLAPGTSATCELRLQKKDGSVIWVASYCRCVASAEEPGHARLYGGLRDITRRKEAETNTQAAQAETKELLALSERSRMALLSVMEDRAEAEATLRESEARYRALFENMAEGFAYCKMLFEDGRPQDFVYLAVNDAFRDLTGLKKDVVGKKVSEVVPGLREADPELFKRYARVALTGEPERFEFYVTAMKMWFDLSVYSPRREHFVTVFDVITDRKRSEAERGRLMTAIEQAGEIIFTTDPQGIIEYVNPAFEHATGYTRQEAIGQTPRILKSGQHDVAFYRELWATISAGRTWQGRFVNKRKDGTCYTEDGAISPVRDAAGVIVNYVAIKRDVTEHLRAYQERALLEEQLRQAQKVESIGRLTGGIAHDFNNMLGIILGYGESALGRLRPQDPIRDDVEQIVQAGRRSAEFTRQLLAFSRRQPLQPTVLDLNATLTNLERMLGRLVGEHIALTLPLAKDLARVKADPNQIEQVILNLVVNARDAMGDGGRLSLETANVVLEAEWCDRHPGATPGKYVMLAVSDTGCGMDQETVLRAFEPFFTTKEAGKGTGLGLSTVYGIVKQSGGSIWISSEPGQGTTVKVYLPQTTEEPAASRQAPVATPRPLGGTCRVLVVEDEDSLRRLVGIMLSRLGFQVTLAANAGEALLHVEENGLKPDVVITDVVMPGMNGAVMVERLRRTQPNLKTLFMSGYTDGVMIHHAALDPGTPFIQKPFNSRDLSAKLQEILAGGLGSTADQSA